MIHPKPATLEGHGVRLEPLAREHAAGLAEAAKDGRLWELFFTSVPEVEQVQAYISGAGRPGRGRNAALGGARPEERRNRRLDALPRHHRRGRRVEIGYTWYAKRMQRTHVNSACKLLLFAHAFESLKCKVVGLRTDNFNFRSQRAIEALGAKKDGVIRITGRGATAPCAIPCCTACSRTNGRT